MGIVKDKDDPVLVRLGQPELFIERLLAEDILIQLRSVLIFDGEHEFAAIRVGIGNIENDHVVLGAKIFYESSALTLTSGAGGRLGLRCSNDEEETDSGDQLAGNSGK